MEKLSDVVDNEVVKNTNFKTLKIKVNNLDKKIPDATTLIHINQCNTDKQNLVKKNRDKKKKQIWVVKWLQLFGMQKVVKLITKYWIPVV